MVIIMTDQVEKSTPQNIKEVLIADRWKILILLGIIFAIAVLMGFDPAIPREARLAGLVMLVTALAAYPYARLVVNYLYRPDYRWLLDLDARDNEIAVWKVPPETFREIELRGELEELHQLTAMEPTYECRDYDPDELEADGTWRASASDIELLAEQERIDEVRTDLEDLAKEGLSLRIKQSGIVRTALRDIINSFIGAFEADAVFDGEKIDEAIEKSLGDLRDDEDDEKPEETHDQPTKEATPPERHEPPATQPTANGALEDTNAE